MEQSAHIEGSNGSSLIIRKAEMADIAAIDSLQRRAIHELQTGFLSDAQIEASYAAMGLDTQLIEDGTYYCVVDGASGALAGCGGWSQRATLYGGNHSGGRDARPLDPSCEPARIRAMYTHPDHARRGVGRLILRTSEDAARAEGFKALCMASTEAGRPLYEAAGYTVSDSFFDDSGGVAVPLHHMTKGI